MIQIAKVNCTNRVDYDRVASHCICVMDRTRVHSLAGQTENLGGSLES